MTTPALDVRALAYRYPDQTPALDGVSFTLAPGECVGLIGPNGAGKSTLLLHLNGLLPERLPHEPAVYINGMPITPENLPAIRRQVGLLFQDPDDQLFCPTVREDVAFGPQQLGLSRAAVDQRVNAALETVHLAHLAERPPHHLSGGEQRRACLAGVLACEPAVLLLDEPTSNLDPRGRREFKALVRQIALARLIATHDLEMVAELCTRVIVLDRGRIVADGPTRPILSDERLMLAHDLEVPHLLTHQHPHGLLGPC